MLDENTTSKSAEKPPNISWKFLIKIVLDIAVVLSTFFGTSFVEEYEIKYLQQFKGGTLGNVLQT